MGIKLQVGPHPSEGVTQEPRDQEAGPPPSSTPLPGLGVCGALASSLCPCLGGCGMPVPKGHRMAALSGRDLGTQAPGWGGHSSCASCRLTVGAKKAVNSRCTSREQPPPPLSEAVCLRYLGQGDIICPSLAEETARFEALALGFLNRPRPSPRAAWGHPSAARSLLIITSRGLPGEALYKGTAQDGGVYKGSSPLFWDPYEFTHSSEAFA